MPVLLADGPSLTSLESTMPLFPSRKLLAVPGSRRSDLLGWVSAATKLSKGRRSPALCAELKAERNRHRSTVPVLVVPKLGKVQVISKQTTSWWFSKGFRKRRNCSCRKGRATILYGKDLLHLDQAKNDESSFQLEIGQMGFCFVYSEFFPSSLVCFFAFTRGVLVRARAFDASDSIPGPPSLSQPRSTHR
ncbi:hypothetical protein HAX54_044134 [Datura stramonium]|uniref:Uncharacterized protein n=1 Tax=Datura stramonium TaxID=4076 RepID=A0ABS8W293_DATST|nr:hypothetical protein [Datura stramonium]